VSVPQPGSSSIEHRDYWWFAARAELLEAGLADHLGSPGRLLDVGSADGPSAAWLRGAGVRTAIDTDPRGLSPRRDVCASALALPFADATFDVVAAFDVVEHLDPEARGVAELARVLRPGGRLLVSVPAYQWAWSDHDVRAGHYRRYTRRRLVRALTGAGLEVERSTYAFALVFPMFAAERLLRRVRRPDPATRLPAVSARQDRLLRLLCHLESQMLRRHGLPFGSSVLAAAVKLR
jgi:SAM-dependent methyltransferase